MNKPFAVINPKMYFDESRVMVRLEEENRWIHGDIERKVEDAITKGPMVEYLMGKNKHWKEKIFHMVDWIGMKMCMGRMEEMKVTNVLKLVHGW